MVLRMNGAAEWVGILVTLGVGVGAYVRAGRANSEAERANSEATLANGLAMQANTVAQAANELADGALKLSEKSNLLSGEANDLSQRANILAAEANTLVHRSEARATERSEVGWTGEVDQETCLLRLTNVGVDVAHAVLVVAELTQSGKAIPLGSKYQASQERVFPDETVALDTATEVQRTIEAARARRSSMDDRITSAYGVTGRFHVRVFWSTQHGAPSSQEFDVTFKVR